MSQDLIIRLQIDKAAAERSSQEFHANEKARIAKTLTDAEAAEKAKTAFIKRENDQRVQELARSQKTTVEQAKAVEDERKRLAKDAAAEQARLIKDVERAAKESARARAEDERQWSKRALTEAEVAERAKTAIVGTENRKRVQAVVEAHGKERTVVGELKGLWDTKVGAIGKAGPAVAGVTAAMATLKIGVTILEAMDDKWRQVTQDIREATKATAEHHKAQLELAGFSGTPGQTKVELQKSADLGAKAGLTIDQATDVRKAFGAGAFAIMDKPAVPAQNGMPAVEAQQGLISQKTKDEVEVLAAKQAAYSGGNAADYGAAAAVIPALAGRRMETPEIEAGMVRLDRFANIGGFDTPSDIVQEVKKVQGYAKSGVVSPEKLEGLIAMYAKTNPAEAATLAKQAISGMSAAPMMERGMHVPDDIKEQQLTMAGWSKDIGIERGEDIDVSLDKAKADVEAKAAAADKAGEMFNPDQFLMSRGVTNQETRAAILAFDRPTWKKEIMPTIGMKVAPGTIDAIHADWQKDPAGRQAMVDAGADQAKNAQGGKHLLMNQLLEQEYNIKKAKGEAVGEFGDYMKPMPWHGVDLGRMVSGQTPNALMEPLAKRLTGELDRLNLSQGAAGAVGADGSVYSTVQQELTGNRTPEQKAAVVNDAMARIQGAGGDTSLGQGDVMNQILEATRAQQRALEQIVANTSKAAAVPIPSGRPVQPAQRP
ncbi:hypothetical protein [Paludisphaera mucosa]|uniref:Uncharacterized protein n=1 Tax=Paludisphaera mucosa TaxID=3030827 RepID=A0ABT6FLR5_9BACT|nr:hypothetical protein [Paludisphaera mucosa]MDG3008525.1 hypothetical protein [Paludisphaera mucosa]